MSFLRWSAITGWNLEGQFALFPNHAALLPLCSCGDGERDEVTVLTCFCCRKRPHSTQS